MTIVGALIVFLIVFLICIFRIFIWLSYKVSRCQSIPKTAINLGSNDESVSTLSCDIPKGQEPLLNNHSINYEPDDSVQWNYNSLEDWSTQKTELMGNNKTDGKSL